MKSDNIINENINPNQLQLEPGDEAQSEILPMFH